MLELKVKPDGITLTLEVENYIRERAARLDAFYDSILSCRVMIEGPVAHHRKGGPYDVKIDFDVPGSVVAVTRQSADDLHVAIRKAFEAAQRQLEDYARRQRGQVKTEIAPPKARVARLFAAEGYGFLETADGQEVYFHRNSVLEPGFDHLEVGTEVRFAEEQGEKGPQASTVSIVGA